MIERPHGRLKYRFERCRCSVCRYAQSAYRQAAADGHRIFAADFVPAAEVREHIRVLSEHGLGFRRLGELTGIHYRTLRSWREGKVTNARRPLAERVLSIRPESVERWLKDATGSARRIMALSSLGWPMGELGARIGWPSANVMRVLRNRWVEPRSAEKIAALYDETSMLLPPESTPVIRARRGAARKMWFPPLAWDDETIDDPQALPCLLPPLDPVDRAVELAVQHRAAGHAVEVTSPVRRELIRRTPERPIPDVAELAQCTRQYVSMLRKQLEREASC